MKKIGIIGGGQLGLMLIEAAVPYNVHFNILDKENCSASYLASKHIISDLYDEKAIKKLAKHSDVLTYEIEHFNVDAVAKLVKKGKIHCIPSPDILHIIQDKHKQKLFFEKYHIPTAPFVSVNSPKEWKEAAKKLNTNTFVAKLHKGGYDGKGVLICDIDDIQEVFDAPCVIEKFIPCEHEIAVMVARDSQGNTAIYPVVEMVFDTEANLLKYLLCPARISEKVAEQAKSIAVQVVECLQGTGIFAVEMFVTSQDIIFVNEIAPRPHNSGHHTIEACYTSQYEQLLRILLDLPLGSTDLIKPAVMLNILGEKGHQGRAVYTGLREALRIEGVYVHLYNKKETQSMRKMGHITVLGDTLEQAIQKAEQIQIKVISN